MARGEIFTAGVEGIAAGGAGIARLDGRIIFLEMTAPGDRVCFSIKKEHKNWAEGELLEIMEASTSREDPVCPLYGRCGGCTLQHLNYEAQIEAKTAILCDSFRRIGGLTPSETPALKASEIRVSRSEPFEYRNRVQFHRIDERRVGFRERKSHRLVALDDCPIAESNIRKALKEAKLISPLNRDRFTVFSRGNTFLSERGEQRGKVSVMGKELAVDAGVFFQSNAAMLELLIPDLEAAASGADRELAMADIYCGVGTFAAFLGEEFSGIDLVEENKNALALARENVRGKKVNFYPLSDTDWIKSQKKDTAKNSWGFMVLDPPRDGLSRPLCEWLAHNGPELAAYVSCDPATLARDARILSNGGYTLEQLTLYDFYPQTAHIESLAIFKRTKEVPSET